ncbi:hypothetical protein [Streptomyces avermitilis]|uniref:hypothetical protein n=1 Tax=Streptomyces avermitilis TaxID=33903 RepID=UPI0036A3A827
MKAAVQTAVMMTLVWMNGLSPQASRGVVRLTMPNVNGLPMASETPAMTASVPAESAAE